LKAAIVLTLFAASAAHAEDAVRFVACPVYRDTDSGAKSGCWLTDEPETGTRYDVSRSPTKPDWNHAILVEGKPSTDGPQACGGKPLDPVRVSVLEAPCTRYMLEAEGYPGRRFALPRRNVRPLYEERARSAQPFAARTVTIPFDFGSSFVTYQLSDFYLDAAINYALDVQPARIVVTGFAASRPTIVSGQLLAEPAALATERAEHVARALRLRGVPADRVTVEVGPDGSSSDEAFDGLEEPSRRRVEVRVSPAAS
jgi:outer membrane protein OmpA-like peptidoglycan-associated protein